MEHETWPKFLKETFLKKGQRGPTLAIFGIVGTIVAAQITSESRDGVVKVPTEAMVERTYSSDSNEPGIYVSAPNNVLDQVDCGADEKVLFGVLTITYDRQPASLQNPDPEAPGLAYCKLEDQDKPMIKVANIN